MSGKRKDKRGRILHEGETQDISGRYRFSYTTQTGKRKSFYSWRLTITDPLPRGKRECVPLREREREVYRTEIMWKNNVFCPQKITVYDLAMRYATRKKNVKRTTKAGYGTVCNMLEMDPFGSKDITSVRAKDAMAWLIELQEQGKSHSTICTVRALLRNAFKEAVLNEWIYKNPFDGFSVSDVIENNTGKRIALTEEEEARFIAFVKEDKHFCRYYDAIFILLHTGMRISEFCGLTKKDVDMDKRQIRINHQLQRIRDTVYCEGSPKTKAGNRMLPMEDEVYECFQRVLEQRPKLKEEPVIDGYSGFLFLDKNNRPTVSMHWQHYFQRIVKKFNKHHSYQLPLITPHVLRHTYCTRKAMCGINPNILQYLMGHSSIEVTLGYYTHARYEDAKRELARLNANATRV